MYNYIYTFPPQLTRWTLMRCRGGAFAVDSSRAPSSSPPSSPSTRRKNPGKWRIFGRNIPDSKKASTTLGRNSLPAGFTSSSEENLANYIYIKQIKPQPQVPNTECFNFELRENKGLTSAQLRRNIFAEYDLFWNIFCADWFIKPLLNTACDLSNSLS